MGLRIAPTLGAALLALALSACGAKPPASDGKTVTAPPPSPTHLSPAEIYQAKRPAVVLIRSVAKSKVAAAEAESDECAERPSGGGTGFVIDAHLGVIVTNAHVILPCPKSWPDVSLLVKAQGAEELVPARIVGVDFDADVAVLKVEHEFAAAFGFASPDSVHPGDEVVAIGFPGLLEGEPTLSRGVISAVSRSYGNLGGGVQTDASVNPGNSGGPLINDRGEVVGINTAVFGRQAQFQGINFAVSASVAKNVSDQIVATGHVFRSDLSPFRLTAIDESGALMQRLLDRPFSAGMLVTEVGEGSPLKGKLQPCDMIEKINGGAIRSPGDFSNAMLLAKPGAEMRIDFVRYPSGKCEEPPPCAGHVDSNSVGTGCPLDPMNRAPQEIAMEAYGGQSRQLDQARLQEQERIDQEAKRILEARRSEGKVMSASVYPRSERP